MRTILILAMTMTMLVSTGCGNGEKEGGVAVKRPTISGVRLEQAAVTGVTVTEEVAGTVTAATTSMVASRIMGTVSEVAVREGDRVAGGQLLARIDDRDMVEKLDQARAAHQAAIKELALARENMALGEITYKRYQALFAEKALSQQELDQRATSRRVAVLEYERVQEMVARAAAAVREAEVGLSFTRIIAPRAGQIAARMVDPGSMALPGVPLFTLEDTSSFRVEANLPERFGGRIAPETAVLVMVPALGRELAGTVTEVVEAVDPRSRTFLVKIAVADRDLQSGRFARVRIPTGEKQALLLPVAAVIKKGQLTGVYVVDDRNIVTFRLVRTGRQYGDRLEILSGVRPGDQVIVDGLSGVTDGGILPKDENHG